MPPPTATTGAALLLPGSGLGRLLAALRDRGHRLIGPALSGGSIEYIGIEGAADLPAGWTNEQDGGRYRLRRRDDGALFGYQVGQRSWKERLFVPSRVLWRARRHRGSIEVTPERDEAPRVAFVGVRACDLAAIAVQDRIFLAGPYADPDYAARRERAFLLAVNCGATGGTCFCASMGTGPRAERGFDLALTELLDGGEHRFLLETGSEAGARVAADLALEPARPEDGAAATAACEATARAMGRTLDTRGIQGLLYGNLEHPRWDDVAGRCLACTNCTLVCPTCFCATVEDLTDLTGENARQERRWDSCFTLGHSYIHGASVRQTHRSRYRQWLVHKLCSWIDQYGVSGCVGCGRCITWCPVAIDITEEVAALRRPPRPRHRPAR